MEHSEYKAWGNQGKKHLMELGKIEKQLIIYREIRNFSTRVPRSCNSDFLVEITSEKKIFCPKSLLQRQYLPSIPYIKKSLSNMNQFPILNLYHLHLLCMVITYQFLRKENPLHYTLLV